jgi:methyl-accepting chemotaxis protein
MISKPISELTHIMQEIASGDGDLTKKIDMNRTDEVGQLASHMNSFITKLHTLLLKTASQAEQVGVASEHLSQVSYETNSEIQQEKEQVDSVSTAVTEMASTVLEISRNAQETNSAAQEVQNLTKVGTDISNEAQTAMTSLASHIGEASQIVSGLEQESGNIGAVVDVINSIADQTNLLALNAAIEAARAGEQGRGFAVVADEVRSLASRTQESTDDIRNMITKLQQIAQQASTMMQEGKDQAESSVTQTQDVLASLTAISNSVTTVQDQSHQIATATEQQTLVAEDINTSLNAINDLVNNTSEHANELASEASDLNNLASGLNESVNQFKL